MKMVQFQEEQRLDEIEGQAGTREGCINLGVFSDGLKLKDCSSMSHHAPL